MKDSDFIEEVVEEGHAARELVQRELSDLSRKQINWKPSPDRWSIGQCLEHLIVSDRNYFPDFEQIGKGQYNMTFWQRYSPLTPWFGSLFKKHIRGKVGIKIPAPDKFKPSPSDHPPEFINTYLKHLNLFLDHITNCRETDLDQTVISSPAMGVITYSLRDTFQFLMQHQHRHIRQALRVKENEHFPGGD